MVRSSHGKWYCRLCGAELGAVTDERPRTMIVGASGRANVRVVIIDGREVHRCPCGLDAIERSAS